MMKKHSFMKKLTSGLLAIGMVCTTLLTGGTCDAKAEARQDIEGYRYVHLAEYTYDYFWDTVEYGSYPTVEIIDKKENSGMYHYGNEEEDYLVDAETYRKLQNTTDWDDNGDTVIDGVKYRKLKIGDRYNIYYLNKGVGGRFNWKSTTEERYFRYEPITWLVLKVDGDKALLISQKAIDLEYFNESNNLYSDYTFWSNATIRSWLNGYGASSNREEKEYTSNNFIDTAFTKAEQSTLLNTTVAGSARNSSGAITLDGMTDTQDKIFLIGVEDMADTGLANGKCRTTSYAAAKGLSSKYGESAIFDTDCVDWMTRTLAEEKGEFYAYYANGYTSTADDTHCTLGIRPSVWIDLNTATYSCSGKYSLYTFVQSRRCYYGHKAVIDAGVAASCTTEGYEGASHCLYCKEVLSEHETISPLGHDVVIDPGTAPTCTTQGISQGSHCQRCGEILEAQTTIPNTGHYEVADNEKKATLTEDGNTEGSHCKNCGEAFMAMTIIPKISKVTLSTSTYTYDGKVKSPSLKVYDRTNALLTKGTDYILETPSGRKSVGRYTYKVTFTGNYEGTKTVTLTINPKGTSISKLTAGKKSFTVAWKKNTTQTSGYEIQYSTSSTFKSAKTVTVSKNSTTSKTIKSLSAKKKYYVRIRTYKTVSSKKYYSAWSAKKYVTTK